MNLKTAIQINHLAKSFGSNQVITDCSMRVEQGTIYGFLGENGAGKTTILKMLTGLLTPDTGSIEILGSDMLRNRDKLLSKIGSLIESPTFYEHLSAKKNLEIHLAYMGVPGISSDNVLKLVGLSNTGEKAVSKFSLGMRQRLGIARALIHQPQILILDEPLNGLDPMGIKDMRELFLNLTQQNGMTILLSSHIISEIEHVADKVGIIVDGRILCESKLAQIKTESKGSLEDYFFNLMSGGKPL
ncbi:ABC-2 type transport system ATP-binding protein [Lacrimispora sphenoides]|jgi:ABC-2 type transport system ATP-binding protein|uniref:ABC transporter ATP-binding protein n=1 Tax=Lacrimispora sphenoides TaxID=29370 RepID=UPI0008AC3B79|nr:ATP-binding cassette domain-containing protein [Lacrimispora sphenoides]SEU10800.1 ABC-2 type transport system ATP-binding protein [Lacrimispora sphenoides]